jgi:hypothetical protein
MPDISMCDGRNCEIRNECYRHTAQPNTNGFQSYFVAPPIFIAENIVEGKCIHFTSNKEETVAPTDAEASSV